MAGIRGASRIELRVRDGAAYVARAAFETQLAGRAFSPSISSPSIRWAW
jgi:hypothetical protein